MTNTVWTDRGAAGFTGRLDSPRQHQLLVAVQPDGTYAAGAQVYHERAAGQTKTELSKGHATIDAAKQAAESIGVALIARYTAGLTEAR